VSVEPLRASVVTLGTFDGVHRGHAELARHAVAEANKRGVPAVGYTFDPHPAAVLAPDRVPPLLISIEERVRRLGGLGLAPIIVKKFDRDLAAVSADEFIERHLVEPLHPIHVVVGFNFTYGRGRQGDPRHLEAAGERWGFGVDAVGPVTFEGEVVSSSRIRELLSAGGVAKAARLLGRPYSIAGSVVQGDRRGRTIGFPTANLEPDKDRAVPAIGVYATRVVLEDGRRLDAVTNVGLRPTFDGTKRTIETFILDFDEDLYGREIALELIERLRGEQKFSGVDALVAQIRRDVEAARASLR
jgi:riboflavin kinase/FMN adenylyltransferase